MGVKNAHPLMESIWGLWEKAWKESREGGPEYQELKDQLQKLNEATSSVKIAYEESLEEAQELSQENQNLQGKLERMKKGYHSLQEALSRERKVVLQLKEVFSREEKRWAQELGTWQESSQRWALDEKHLKKKIQDLSCELKKEKSYSRKYQEMNKKLSSHVHHFSQGYSGPNFS